MKHEVIHCLTWYANMVAQTVQYNWADDFCRKEIREAHDEFINEIKKYIDFQHLTREEAIELGFGKWDDDMPDLYLIPLYLLPAVPIGIELTSIFGDKIIYDGSNVDNDIRLGCIAWGVEIKDEDKEE